MTATASPVHVNLDDLPHVLTVGEYAAIMRVSRDVVERQCRTGEIVSAKVGGAWRIPKSAIPAALVPPPPSEDPIDHRRRGNSAAADLAAM